MLLRALALVVCALALPLAASGDARAQAASFPPTLDAASLTQWLRTSTSLPANMVVSIGSSSIIGLRSVKPAEPAAPGMFRASVWAEVISPVTAAKGGYLSWSAEVDVDCSGRRSKAIEVTNFPERALRGTPKPAGAAAGWVTPTAGTQLYSLISAVCDPSFSRPFSPVSAVAARPAPPTAAPPALASSRPAPPQPAAAPPPVALVQAPPAQPVPQAAPSEVASAPGPAAPVPATAPAPAPADKTPAPVAKVDILPETPPAATPVPSPAPPARPTIARGRSSAAVQVAAGDTANGASQALNQVQRRFEDELAGLDASVAKADVGGRTVYRVLIHGFASRAGAATLCERLQGLGQACFVRNDFHP